MHNTISAKVMNRAMWADKVEAINLLGLSAGPGRSCSQYPASSRAGKVLHILVVLRQMDVTPNFHHHQAAPSPGLLHSAETRNHPTCSEEPWAWWSCWAETPGQCRFRKSSLWAGLCVPMAELCAGLWAAGRGWVHPAHIHHGLSSCWIDTDSRHKTSLPMPLQPVGKVSKYFISNTGFSPLGWSLVRL